MSNRFATLLDADNFPVAIDDDGRAFYPTPCCGAYASIGDSCLLYCKACYEEAPFYTGAVPKEPFRLIA